MQMGDGCVVRGGNTMRYFDKILLAFLLNSKIKMEVTGFDMDGFKGAVEEEGKRRLEMIESIIYLEDDLMADSEKVSTIKQYFKEDFCL